MGRGLCMLILCVCVGGGVWVVCVCGGGGALEGVVVGD